MIFFFIKSTNFDYLFVVIMQIKITYFFNIYSYIRDSTKTKKQYLTSRNSSK